MKNKKPWRDPEFAKVFRDVFRKDFEAKITNRLHKDVVDTMFRLDEPTDKERQENVRKFGDFIMNDKTTYGKKDK